MSTIKVMIVDDEVLAIEDLRNLITWEKHGFQIVAEAANGKRALELYDKYHPQIIFADISMPVMDGLEFSRRIVQCGDNAKIILLTSYKDFEYAKQAVKIGVSDYLLKHEINEDKLLEELQSIKTKIENEERMQRLKKQELVKRLLEGKKLDNNDNVYCDKNIGDYNNFALLVVKKDMPYQGLQTVYEENEQSIDSIYYSENEYVKLIDTIEIKPSLYAILTSVKKISSSLEMRKVFCNIAMQVQKNYREINGHTLSIVIITNLFNEAEICKAYKKAVNIADYTVFAGKEKILWPEEMPI